MGISTTMNGPTIIQNSVQISSSEGTDADQKQSMEIDGNSGGQQEEKTEAIAKILIDFCLGTSKSKSQQEYNDQGSKSLNLALFKSLAKDYNFKDYIENETGCSLLHHAITTRHQGIFDLLIEIGADVNVPNKTFLNTPLHIACLLPSPLPWINKLVLSGALVNTLNHRFQTPLHVLLCNPQISSVNQILQCMDLLLLCPIPPPRNDKIQPDHSAWQTLHNSTQQEVFKEINNVSGKLEDVQRYNPEYYYAAARINGVNAPFKNKLMREILNQPQQDIVGGYSILRKSLSQPNESITSNEESPTPIDIKCHGVKNCPIPSPEDRSGRTDLTATQRRTQILCSKDGYARLTPLLCTKFALFRRDFAAAYAIAHKLLPLGACPNEQDKDGRTLLSYSVTYLDDSINLTRILVNFGARVYVTNLLHIPTDKSRASSKANCDLRKNGGDYSSSDDNFSRYHLRTGHHLLGTNDKLFGHNFYPLDFEVEDGCRSQLVFGEFKVWKEHSPEVDEEPITPSSPTLGSCRFQASYDNASSKHYEQRRVNNNNILKRKFSHEKLARDGSNNHLLKNKVAFVTPVMAAPQCPPVKCYREICELCETYCLVPLNNHRRRRKIETVDLISKPYISTGMSSPQDSARANILETAPLTSSSYKVVRVDDDQNCFNWFLKAVISRRKLENYRKTLVILAGTMGQDPVRMRTGVIRSMFIHLQCFRVLGPLFLRIKNLLAPFWTQPRPLKYLASLALRQANARGGRCPHDFPGHLEGGSPTLPKSLQRYLLFLEEEESDKLDYEIAKLQD